MCGSASKSIVWTSLGFCILATLTWQVSAHFGSCQDHTDDCPKWKSWGYCRTTLRFMALNCPESCEVCVDPGCFDKDPDCPKWVEEGRCVTNRTVMDNFCRHSCNFCRLPVLGQSHRSLTMPDFECGKFTRVRGRRSPRTEPIFLFPDEVEEYRKLIALNVKGIASLHENEKGAIAPLNINNGGNQNICGATLIHERFLVTAAHCVLDPTRPIRTVRLGELDFLSDNERGAQPADYRVRLITVHPRFNAESPERYNDIAIIETEEKVQFNEAVFPFCVSNMKPRVGSVVTGSGFGFVNNTHQASFLQEAELNIIGSMDCLRRYQREGLLEEVKLRYPDLLEGKDIICASFPGRDTCQGDSGGPLFMDNPLRNGQRQRFLVGVVAQGISCRGNGISTLPGFYISIADHIDFINSVVYAM